MSEKRRRTPAIPERPAQPIPVSRFIRVFGQAAAAATANPVIPFRYGRPVPDGPQALVAPRYQRFPYFEQPAQPGIAWRYGRVVLGAILASVPPFYFQFPLYIPKSAPIEFRYGRIPAANIDVLIRPAYFSFPYQSAAPANPVPGFVYGRPIPPEVLAIIPPQVFRFPYFQQAVTANAFIAFRSGQLLGQENPRAVSFSAFQLYSVSTTVQQPVIPIRVQAFIGWTVESWLVRPQVFAFPFYKPTTAPISFIYAKVRPVEPTPPVTPIYFTFPYQSAVVATANPVPGFFYGRIAPEERLKPVQPGYFSFTPFQGQAAANAVIPFIKGQWLGDIVRPLIGIQGYQRFPFKGSISVVADQIYIPTYRRRRR